MGMAQRVVDASRRLAPPFDRRSARRQPADCDRAVLRITREAAVLVALRADGQRFRRVGLPRCHRSPRTRARSDACARRLRQAEGRRASPRAPAAELVVVQTRGTAGRKRMVGTRGGRRLLPVHSACRALVGFVSCHDWSCASRHDSPPAALARAGLHDAVRADHGRRDAAVRARKALRFPSRALRATRNGISHEGPARLPSRRHRSSAKGRHAAPLRASFERQSCRP